MFHDTSVGDFLLIMKRDPAVSEVLAGNLLERAIGAIYRPETERISHYFQAALSRQFDAVIHIDRTRALIPLEKTTLWEKGEIPETYPSSL